MPLHAEAVAVMTNAFKQIERVISPPQQVTFSNSFVFRYANKGIREAIVQKLARSISGLNAISILLQAGFTQEVGVLFRTLDEINEDIMFLATAETNRARTNLHEKYLKAFFAEPVFLRPQGTMAIAKQDLVPRRKIRAHTMTVFGQGVNVSQALTAGEAISTAFSGYVHANSESIMDMYGGNPASFHLEGMPCTSRIDEYTRSTENYIYRGLMTTLTAAKAFGDVKLVELLYIFLAKYESANGHTAPLTAATDD